jgi:hypothetical protein
MDLGKLSELSHHRKCQECGAEFETIPASKGEPEVPALQQFSDHLTSHQATPTQWGEAYSKIAAGRESARGRL